MVYWLFVEFCIRMINQRRLQHKCYINKYNLMAEKEEKWCIRPLIMIMIIIHSWMNGSCLLTQGKQLLHQLSKTDNLVLLTPSRRLNVGVSQSPLLVDSPTQAVLNKLNKKISSKSCFKKLLLIVVRCVLTCLQVSLLHYHPQIFEKWDTICIYCTHSCK